MTKFNLNPNYKTKKRKAVLKVLFKPVYLSIILIIIFFIITTVHNNKLEAIKSEMIMHHSEVLSNPKYKKSAEALDIRAINSYILNTRAKIFSYKFKMVHQNVQEIFKKLSSAYSQYLPAGFIIHSLTYVVNSDNASKTSIEIYYLKDYMDEVKAFTYSAKNYINEIKLKDFDNNGKD
jgi:hypothetical protein